MVRVMASGVFDLLHAGHIYFLEEASRLGDELVVVVATDTVAERMKYRPVTSQEMRLKVIRALKMVDRAVLGNEEDIYRTVEDLRPDIIALGYDQKHEESTIRKVLDARGMPDVRIVRLGKFIGELAATREMIRKIIEWYALRQRLGHIEGEGGP